MTDLKKKKKGASQRKEKDGHATIETTNPLLALSCLLRKP